GCNLVFGIGIVKGNLRLKTVIWALDGDFENEVKSYLKFPIKFTLYKECDKVLSAADDYEGDTLTYAMFIENFDDYDEAHKNAIYYAWWTAFNNGNYIKTHKSNVILSIDIELLYNGNVIQTFSESDSLGGSTINYITGGYYAEDISPDLTLNGNFAL
ncbi:MAG: hypothetical protein K2O67_05940, partial [Clostridia bacterium]|nr:hypothetical protein [Clostridia bacterium]